MRAMNAVVAAVLVASGLISTYSAAEVVVVVDPDNFEAGENLTHAVPGVTMTRLWQDPYTVTGYSPSRGDVFAVKCAGIRCPPSAGSQVFGYGAGQSELEGYAYHECLSSGHYTPCTAIGFNVIEQTFRFPTDYFEVRIGYTGLSPIVYAYDAAGQLIAACSESSPVCDRDYMFDQVSNSFTEIISLQSGSRRVARIVVGGYGDPATFSQVSFSESDPARLLRALADEIKQARVGRGLSHRIELALVYYEAGDQQATCAVMTDFVLTVQHLTSWKKPKLSPPLGAEFVEDAVDIMNLLGCR